MNTSFSKESLSSLTSQGPSTPTTRSVREEPVLSQSELWERIEAASLSSQTGNLVLLNESTRGERVLSPPNEVKSVPSSSLQSKVGPEKLLESLQQQPARKVLRISRADLNSIACVLEQYKAQIEKMVH